MGNLVLAGDLLKKCSNFCIKCNVCWLLCFVLVLNVLLAAFLLFSLAWHPQ